MKKLLYTAALYLLFSFPIIAQNIVYHVHMEKPENRYFQVEMIVENWKKNELEVKLPVWAPGSYLVRGVF